MPLVSRTRATLRSAEFGFLGVTVYTRVHTPRFCGAPRRAGVFVLPLTGLRGWRTSWLTVGMRPWFSGFTTARRTIRLDRPRNSSEPVGRAPKDRTQAKARLPRVHHSMGPSRTDFR